MEFTLSNCLMASYLRLHAIRSDYKRKSGRFNIGFGLFIYISIPFLVFLKILCKFKSYLQTIRLHRTVTRCSPPLVQVNNVKSQPPDCISDTAVPSKVVISQTSYRCDFP